MTKQTVKLTAVACASTSYTYDDRGRVTRTTDPLGGTSDEY